MHCATLFPLALTVLAAASSCIDKDPPDTEGSSIDAAFIDFPKGGITVFDEKNARWIRYNPERCRKRFVLAYTFKIIHSLIGLETGVIDGPDHELKWDGEARSIAAWNRDHDLRSAISRSVVWYFEEVARSVPPEQMSSLLSACDYGNHKTSGTPPFWISGDLAISTDEQVALLRRLRGGELPFKKTVMTP